MPTRSSRSRVEKKKLTAIASHAASSGRPSEAAAKREPQSSIGEDFLRKTAAAHDKARAISGRLSCYNQMQVSSACDQLLGAMHPGTAPTDRAVLADVKASDLPVEFRRLRPRRVTTSLVDVDIQLGTYAHPGGERDYWGVVCSKGSFRNAFLKGDGKTFLRQLREHAWYYDGVM